MKRFNLLNIILMIFLDFLGMTLLFPILTPLIVDPSSPLVPFWMEDSMRSILLGLVISLFPLCQFAGSIYLGSFSDAIGKKKVLLFSLVIGVLGYGACALSIASSKLLLLFLGRALTGFAAGNLCVAQAAIVDLSSPEDLSKNFGLMGAAIGIGFILGPFIGSLSSNYTSVFILGMILTTLNAIQLAICFKDNKIQKAKLVWNPLKLLTSILRAIPTNAARMIFFISFLYLMGWYFFTEFYPLLLVKKLGFDETQIGRYFVYVGVWIVVAQVILLKPLSDRFKHHEIIRVTLLLLALSLFLMLIPTSWTSLLLVVPVTAVLQATTMPTALAMMSSLADQSNQGSVLGLNAAMQALAMLIPPIISGFAANWFYGLPTLLGALFILSAWLLFVRVQGRVFSAPQQA